MLKMKMVDSASVIICVFVFLFCYYWSRAWGGGGVGELLKLFWDLLK
jgi:hypothetical protein